MSKGGYHPQARLATHHDEILLEALCALESESVQVKDRAFREIARLARRCVELLESASRPGGPSLAVAGA